MHSLDIPPKGTTQMRYNIYFVVSRISFLMVKDIRATYIHTHIIHAYQLSFEIMHKLFNGTFLSQFVLLKSE